MNYLFVLLAFVSGLLTSRSLLFIAPFLLLLVRTFKDKKTFILIISFFLFGVFIMILKGFIYNLPFNKGVALVTKAGKNHVIILTVRGKYYVSLKSHNLTEGDIVFVKGEVVPYFFSSLEGEFNYGEYLQNKGIKKAFAITLIEVKLPSLLRLFRFMTTKSVYYPAHLENIKNLLLTRAINYDDPFTQELMRLDLLFLISLTGAHLNFLRRLIKKISSIFVKDVTAEVISYLSLVPLFLVNVTKLAFYRIFLGGILRAIIKKRLNSLFSATELTSIACFILLFINPYLVSDPAFYLAYILSFLFQLLSPAKGIKGRLQSFFIVFSVIFPYQVFTRGTFNLVFIFVGTLLVPLISVWTFIYFITLFIGPLQTIGINVLQFVYILVNLLTKLNITFYFGDLHLLTKLLLVTLLSILLYAFNARIKILQRNLGVLTGFILLLNLLPIKNLTEYGVTFINVGQGDSTLLRLKNKYVLVDTGGLTNKDIARDVLIPYFKRNKIFRLDYLIITHDDFDHAGAKDSLLNNFKVKEVVTTRESFPITLNGVTISNLNNAYYDDLNYDSLVLYVNLPRLNVLLMGDAGIINEKALLNNYPNLTVDILKVGHHGSNTSTSEEFIKHFTPKIAVISCGYKNYYGHPHQSVLDTLNKYGVTIRRTDIEGTITVNSCII